MYTSMKAFLRLLFCASLFIASCNTQADTRQKALKKAQGYIKQGMLSTAYFTLDSVLLSNPSTDTAYYLHADLQQATDTKLLEAHASKVANEKDGWQRLTKDGYTSTDFGLHFPSSMGFMKTQLLAMKAQMPRLAAQREKDRKQAAVAAAEVMDKQAKLAVENEVLLEAENYEKRGKVEAGLRETFLDQGMDVEVKVSGKRRSRITLTYALMGAVMSHQMKKAGNIDALLDLGFKEVVLADGYDYRTIWRRK